METTAGKPPRRGASDERRQQLLRRLRDAQAIMGCGDTPDVGAAVEECTRLEGALADLELTRAAEGRAPC